MQSKAKSPSDTPRTKSHFISIPETLAIHEMLNQRLHVYEDKTCEYREPLDNDSTVAGYATNMLKVPIKLGHVARIRNECFGSLRHNRKAPVLADAMELIRELTSRIERLEREALSHNPLFEG